MHRPISTPEAAVRKFGNYPIMVNYNLHTRLRNEYQEQSLHQAGKLQQEKELFIKVTQTSDTMLKEFLWQQELDQFEGGVCDQLQKIAGNIVGRKVLDLINKKTTVWIVPKSEAELKKCSCAQTWPLNYDIPKDKSYAYGSGFGDTVIQFDTSLGDDTLLHELVHAYRYSCKLFKEIFIRVENKAETYMQNIEEFFAHEIENVYLSQVGGTLTKDYKDNEISNKDDIYDFLAVNDAMLNALKDLVKLDPLASTAACCFRSDYNPFRDCGEIEARSKQYKAMVGEP